MSNIHAFDFDHTLIKANSSYRFGRFLYSQGYMTLTTMARCVAWYLLYKLGRIPQETLHYKNFDLLFRRKNAREIDILTDRFVSSFPEALWNQEVVDLYRSAQERGEEVLVLSSSPSFLVEKLAASLSPKEVHATHYVRDDEGGFSHIGRIVNGQAKREFMQCYMQENGGMLHVYTDHEDDRPLLELADVPHKI